MKNLALGLLVTAFSLLELTAAVEGYDPAYQINVNSGSTPDIDGTIVTGEWDDASAVLFNNTAAFVKQDGENLYIAFNVSDRTREPDDYAEVGIDVLNDGGNISRDDDFVLLMKSSGNLGEFHNATQVTPTGWTAESNYTDDYWQGELNITYAKLQITSGEPKALGLALMAVDNNTISGLWPPMDLSNMGPSNWGNLISEENWIPEFSLSTIISLFIMATPIATITLRKRHKP